jgi:Xaa-Pro aminopeptidase
MIAMAAALGDALGELRGRRVGVDEITGAMARHGVLAGADLLDARVALAPARLVKTMDEVRCTDAAQRLNEVAMESARAAAVPGATRSEVTGVFLRRIHEMGCTICMIDPIFEVVPKHREHGPRTSTGHIAFPTGVDDPVLAEGDLVWVDTGIGYEGYVSDFGRTWVVGRDPLAEEVELFERWMAVTDASCAAIRPGATLGNVGRAAAAADAAAGGERPWLPHFYLAHGIGVESAEMPMIGTDLGQDFDDGFVLQAGMLLVLEPIAWRDGFGGYRAEEIVAVTDDGCRLLGAAHHYLPFAGPVGPRFFGSSGTAPAGTDRGRPA